MNSSPPAVSTEPARAGAITPPFVRRRLIELGAVTATSLLVLVTAYLFFVRTALGQELDRAALAGTEQESRQLIADAWALLNPISVSSLALATVGIGAVAVLRDRYALALAAVATIATATVTTEVLKKIVLDRPDLIGEGAVNTLPSGHVTVAASVTVALVMVTAPRWRSTAAPVMVLFPIGVSIAVVTASWHRPSDVVAAWAVVLASASLWLMAAVVAAGIEHGARPPLWFRRSVILAFAAATVVLGGFGLLGLAAVRDRLSDGPLTARWEAAAYVSSSAGVTAVALACMLIVVLLLRSVAVGDRGAVR